MMTMRINYKILTNLIFGLTGILILTAFIWFRFIRQRLPRDIPFNLNEYGCIILFYICSLYLFVIITLLIPFKGSNISTIMNHLYKPLKFLDEIIKTNAIINIYYKKTFIYIVNNITKQYYNKLYYIYNIFPRIILLVVLCFDVFYFGKIAYLYYIILIGLLPLIYKYMIYSLRYAKEQYILKLEPMIELVMTDYNEDPTDNDWNYISLHAFIEIQANSIFLNNHKHHCNPLPSNSYGKQIDTQTKDILDIVIKISVHLQWFGLYDSFDNNVKYMKIGIFSTYLICWSYILIVSLPRLPPEAFEWLWIIQDIENPFSILLHKYETYR